MDQGEIVPEWITSECERSSRYAEDLAALCRQRAETVRTLLAEQRRINALVQFARADLHAVLRLTEQQLVQDYDFIATLVTEAMRVGNTEAAVHGALALGHYAPMKYTLLERQTSVRREPVDPAAEAR
jgi:NADH:ubiquinone oxidoreductase subunit D